MAKKSGFVLTRRPLEGNKLQAIDDNDINFAYVKEHGTAIVMKNPQYRLHKTLSAVKRNLLKIFPLVDNSFRIHVIRGNEQEIIDSFDDNVMKELCTLIAFGTDYSQLAKLVPDYFPAKRVELVESRATVN